MLTKEQQFEIKVVKRAIDDIVKVMPMYDLAEMLREIADYHEYVLSDEFVKASQAESLDELASFGMCIEPLPIIAAREKVLRETIKRNVLNALESQAQSKLSEILEMQSLDEKQIWCEVAPDIPFKKFHRVMDEICLNSDIELVGKRSDFERDVDPEEDFRVFMKNIF